MANKIYLKEETSITFNASAGASNVAFTPSGLIAESGWQSIPRALGGSGRSRLYKWRARTKTESVPFSLDGSVEIYWANGDDEATMYIDGGLPSGNQVIADPLKKKNLQYLGSIDFDDSTEIGKGPFTKTGIAELVGDYGCVVWFNNMQANLENSNFHTFILTPIPDEIQDAA